MAGHLAACSVTAIAACSASAANAAIVYSGPVNFVAAVDIDGTYINVETNQLTNGPASEVPGWDVNPYRRATTGSGMNFFSPTGGGQMRYTGVTTGPAGNLAVGTSIGATGSFNIATTDVVFGSAAGNWQYSAENVIGFRFVGADAGVRYGWMRFLMGSQPATGNLVTRTVVDYTFEDQARVAILAGDNGARDSPFELFRARSAAPVRRHRGLRLVPPPTPPHSSNVEATGTGHHTYFVHTHGLSRAGFLLPPPASGRPMRLLMLGWDGADWDVLDPLLEAGALPHLAGLLARGWRAPLASLEPRLSPLLWTSAITGVTPDRHGVLNFVEPSPDGQGLRLASSTSRRCRALWNLLQLCGLRSHVVNWYATHPAEPINGVVLSNQFFQASEPPA
ncbi:MULTISPECIES: alkaline phosphatase family protein [unclassified Cyanobium]|uniref:alkaline phosphatase family protein n=1 Tax=unclassified Cyanobium TaxID=2627006 RepID=UPI0020CF4B69|nr:MULTISPECIES: alkaline phosphatase family protein [unclassified Cyanobium]MCP9859171.1 alkaline phosphatase family protein [Cyanobium sp. Cruz-8H5]MCP9866436.1 alkaline phosphatase family protein [Cyanobium sp. Cruz-8D1]